MKKLTVSLIGTMIVTLVGTLAYADGDFGKHMSAMGTALKCIEKKASAKTICDTDANEATILMTETAAAESLQTSYFKDLPADAQADVAQYFVSLKAKISDLQAAIQNGDATTEASVLTDIDTLKSNAHDKYKD